CDHTGMCVCPREGLFAKRVQAGLESRHRHLEVQIVWRGDHYCVAAAVPDELTVVLEYASRAEICGDLVRASGITAAYCDHLGEGVAAEARHIHEVDPPAGADNSDLNIP